MSVSALICWFDFWLTVIICRDSSECSFPIADLYIDHILWYSAFSIFWVFPSLSPYINPPPPTAWHGAWHFRFVKTSVYLPCSAVSPKKFHWNRIHLYVAVNHSETVQYQIPHARPLSIHTKSFLWKVNRVYAHFHYQNVRVILSSSNGINLLASSSQSSCRHKNVAIFRNLLRRPHITTVSAVSSINDHCPKVHPHGSREEQEIDMEEAGIVTAFLFVRLYCIYQQLFHKAGWLMFGYQQVPMNNSTRYTPQGWYLIGSWNIKKQHMHKYPHNPPPPFFTVFADFSAPNC